MRMIKRKAYSLFEAVIVVSIMAVLAFVALPRLQWATLYRQQSDTVARKIVTDLRRTRRLAISDAAANTDGFELNVIKTKSFNGYEIVNRDTKKAVDSITVDSRIAFTCPSGQSFKFGPLGNLLSGSGTQIDVSAEGKSFTIMIVPATGAVKCVENWKD